MNREGPPNIWLETHSSLTVSNSIPAQRVREKKKEGRGQEKKKKRKRWEAKRSNQSNEFGLRDDTRPLSLWIIPALSLNPHHTARIILQRRAERTNVVKTTPRSPLCVEPSLSLLSALCQIMTQDGDMWTQRAVKTDVGPIPLVFCF